MEERPKVGEILMRAGIIDEYQLKAALGEQARWGRALGTTLVKLGFVEERDLVRALASQLDLPVASLEGKRIHPDVLALVPAEMAVRHQVIPLFVKTEGRTEFLFLGMEDPGLLEVMDDLRFRTGMQVKPVMVCPSELWEGIDRYYPSDERSEPIELECDVEGGAPDEPVAILPDFPVADPGSTAPMQSIDLEPDAPAEEPASLEAIGGRAIEGEPAEETPGEVAPEGEARRGQPSDAPEVHDPGEEKTRTLLHAMTQILIEKGIMTREEFHDRIQKLSEGG